MLLSILPEPHLGLIPVEFTLLRSLPANGPFAGSHNRAYFSAQNWQLKYKALLKMYTYAHSYPVILPVFLDKTQNSDIGEPSVWQSASGFNYYCCLKLPSGKCPEMPLWKNLLDIHTEAEVASTTVSSLHSTKQ